MPIELYVHVVPPEYPSTRKVPEDGRVYVTHIFRGETEEEAREVFAQHAKGCEFLTPAIAEGRVEEEILEIDADEWPAYDAQGELTSGDEDEEDDEPEDE
jgi:hypothetical protein